MNLVLDDAVEVKQITKTNDKETRTPLGAYKTGPSARERRLAIVLLTECIYRPDPSQR